MAERQTGAAVAVTSTQFQIAAIFLFSLALLSIFARILLKIQQSRVFYLDDYMLFLSTICFTAGMGLIFRNSPMQGHLEPLKGTLILLWTTTFLAKFSILVFLRRVVIAMKSKKMVWYYEITVGICVVGWIYVVATPFMAEPDSGLYVGLTYVGTGVDVLLVVIITSLPLLILHRPHIPTGQILALMAFVALSILQIIFCIVRTCKLQSTSWTFLFTYTESAITVLTVSLTCWRTFCNLPAEVEARRSKLKQSIRHKRNSSRFDSLSSLGKFTVTALPEVPKRSWRGLKYFVSRRGKAEEEVVFERCESGFGWLEKNDEPKSPTVSYREMGLCGTDILGETMV